MDNQIEPFLTDPNYKGVFNDAELAELKAGAKQSIDTSTYIQDNFARDNIIGAIQRQRSLGRRGGRRTRNRNRRTRRNRKSRK